MKGEGKNGHPRRYQKDALNKNEWMGAKATKEEWKERKVRLERMECIRKAIIIIISENVRRNFKPSFQRKWDYPSNISIPHILGP